MRHRLVRRGQQEPRARARRAIPGGGRGVRGASGRCGEGQPQAEDDQRAVRLCRRRVRRPRPYADAVVRDAGRDLLQRSCGAPRARPLPAIPGGHQAPRFHDANARRLRSHDRQDSRVDSRSRARRRRHGQLLDQRRRRRRRRRGGHLRRAEGRRHDGRAALARRDGRVDARLRNLADDDRARGPDRRSRDRAQDRSHRAAPAQRARDRRTHEFRQHVCRRRAHAGDPRQAGRTRDLDATQCGEIEGARGRPGRHRRCLRDEGFRHRGRLHAVAHRDRPRRPHRHRHGRGGDGHGRRHRRGQSRREVARRGGDGSVGVARGCLRRARCSPRPSIPT